ncbi:MAG: NAD(P)/FAD-dependent oxidoreductase [Parachlamydiaceae bacterium]|nr:NAD(P)/FAD-dependent oxidoreductase [Parachlamydiaceae bacterium]
MSKQLTIAIIGGGAAGFFGAITCAHANPTYRVIIIEKVRQVLAKVRISGGGRCNVTHACFDPALLIQNYPRGGKELRGPFSRFQPRDTIQWFESHRVPLKVEEDGRMFPTTDSSETIVNCLMQQARASKVELWTERGVLDCQKTLEGFQLKLTNDEVLNCDRLLIATGSSTKTHAWLEMLGHTIAPPVPSLFTFNVPNSPLLELAGTSVSKAKVSIEGTSLQQIGPLLITHWGFSGPAILKLSAWGARILYDMKYRAIMRINWLPDLSVNDIKDQLMAYRQSSAIRQLSTESPFPFSKNLWKAFLMMASISHELKWAALSNQNINSLIEILHAGSFQIDGKSTYKDEFVTCGGINLQEINFKTMESRICANLYFAGEVLDIDGVTGGFNFQNAWTTAWIAGKAMAG